jgi:hypothetical protein
MNVNKIKSIRHDVALSLYHDLSPEQYKQFKDLHLLRESVVGKTYRAIWATPNFSKTACILLKDFTVQNYPVAVQLYGFTNFSPIGYYYNSAQKIEQENPL